MCKMSCVLVFFLFEVTVLALLCLSAYNFFLNVEKRLGIYVVKVYFVILSTGISMVHSTSIFIEGDLAYILKGIT